MSVGGVVGAFDGLSVGDEVGFLVGAVVGVAEGFPVGLDDGICVGVIVGAAKTKKMGKIMR